MEIPRSEERFTPAAVGMGKAARQYGCNVPTYTTTGDALRMAATAVMAYTGVPKDKALAAAGKLGAIYAKRAERGKRESYYGAGQAKRDYDRLRHK